jgi:hypothetical protein
MAPDPKLQKKIEEENSKDLEKILLIDQKGSHRVVDLVEEAKVPKWEHNC